MPEDNGYRPPHLQMITHEEADLLAALEHVLRKNRETCARIERGVKERCERDGLAHRDYNHVAVARQHIAIAVANLATARGGEVSDIDDGTMTFSERVRQQMQRVSDEVQG